ncbi:hypothetical protein [Streptosporangium minutum]|uniref:Uncharacterized protein n=1 Tax=Streptosporangium minutum TaxID=569862 RepID=A0A243RPX4_9ACTN|nr:hypothetical protein [Streptosporangium minutum]OUC97013.1 hypothetical protein CA984_12840 [Streptosporangium minutum]
MRPVTKIATGFVFAFGALRFNGFDLLLNPVGWLVCVSGLSQLQRSADGPFSRARSSAIVMVCVSLVAMVSPGERSDYPLMVLLVKHVIDIADTAGALIAVWLTVDAVIRRIRPCGDISRAVLLDVLRWAVVGLGALGTLVGYGYTDLDPVLIIAWFAAVVALIVVLYRSAHLPCLSPIWGPVVS